MPLSLYSRICHSISFSSNSPFQNQNGRTPISLGGVLKFSLVSFSLCNVIFENAIGASEFKKYFKKHSIIDLFRPITGFRVLTICKSQERIDSLIKAAKEMGKWQMFWFTQQKQFKKHNTLFDCF